MRKSEGVKELRERVCRQLYGSSDAGSSESVANTQWRCCIGAKSVNQKIEYITSGENDDFIVKSDDSKMGDIEDESNTSGDELDDEGEKESLLWKRLKEKFSSFSPNSFKLGSMASVNAKMGRKGWINGGECEYSEPKANPAR